MRHQPGVQYSAVEWIKAKVAVHNVASPTPHLDSASRLKSPTRVVNFLRSDSKCRGNVSALYSFMPMQVGLAQKCMICLSTEVLSSRRIFLL